MRTRFLPIFFGVVFALTLFFAVAAGAQVQVQQVQQQQVGVEKIGGEPAPPSGPLAGANVVVKSNDQGDTIDSGDELRIKSNCSVESGASITIEDGDGTQGTFVDNRNADMSDDEERITVEVTGNPIGENGGDGELDEDGDVEVVTSTGIQCGDRNDDDNDDNNDTNDGNTNNDTNTDTTETTTTQDTTDTTTDTTDTTDDALETTTADNADSVRDADAFRCEFFLRAVRDDRGALRDQYVGDELIVQRFEQCLSEDVLADTIPDRRLPFTGGPLLPSGGGLLLVVAAAVLAGRIIRR